ncbi:hypothetical protein QP166_03385 [Sphingomonas sp. LR60]|uniref:hypothetical protein n=1 Tax=Sphingomonas sp. LR60 TaxID=3050233 RepID=UPI002FDFAC80
MQVFLCRVIRTRRVRDSKKAAGSTRGLQLSFASSPGGARDDRQRQSLSLGRATGENHDHRQRAQRSRGSDSDYHKAWYVHHPLPAASWRLFFLYVGE